MDYNTHINDICTQRFGQTPEAVVPHDLANGVLQYTITVGDRVFELFFLNPDQLDSCVFYYQTLKRIGIPAIDIVHFGRISPEIGFYMLNHVKGRPITEQAPSRDVVKQTVEMLKAHQKAGFTGYGSISGTMQFYTPQYESLYGFIDGQIKTIYDHLLNYGSNTFDKIITKLLDYRHTVSETEKSSLAHGNLLPASIITEDHTVTFILPGTVRLSHPAWDIASLEIQGDLDPTTRHVTSEIVEEAKKALEVTDKQVHFFVLMQLLRKYIHSEIDVSSQILKSAIEKAGAEL